MTDRTTPAGAAQAVPADPTLRQAAQTLAALAWLERDYDKPGAFEQPATSYYAPAGLYEIYDDHPADCLCEDDLFATKRSPQ